MTDLKKLKLDLVEIKVFIEGLKLYYTYDDGLFDIGIDKEEQKHIDRMEALMKKIKKKITQLEKKEQSKIHSEQAKCKAVVGKDESLITVLDALETQRKTVDRLYKNVGILKDNWLGNISKVASNCMSAKGTFETLLKEQKKAEDKAQKSEAALKALGLTLFNLAVPFAANVLSHQVSKLITKPATSANSRISGFAQKISGLNAEELRGKYAEEWAGVITKVKNVKLTTRANPDQEPNKPSVDQAFSFVHKWYSTTYETFSTARQKMLDLLSKLDMLDVQLKIIKNSDIGTSDFAKKVASVVSQVSCKGIAAEVGQLQGSISKLAAPTLMKDSGMHELFLKYYLLKWLPALSYVEVKTVTDYSNPQDTILVGGGMRTIYGTKKVYETEYKDVLANEIRKYLKKYGASGKLLDFKNGKWFSSEPENDIKGLISWGNKKLETDFGDPIWKKALGLV
ncbi:MAG: hypothetical protein MK207_15030 [Saprospiraceae bacterium]|nr:hypothetical protein [Saprospiraceae bacterium]